MTGPSAVADAFEFVGLVRRFGEVVALDDVSFSVAAGEMVGFVGPNGAGKTTAMRIALGLLQADTGAVRWRGRAVDAETRRRFGYMPEERGLYPKMRVLDQLVYLARLHGLEPGDARSQAERMTELLGDSLWTIGNCATSRSYYFNPMGEPTLLRPMSTSRAIKEASDFPLSDYQIA